MNFDADGRRQRHQFQCGYRRNLRGLAHRHLLKNATLAAFAGGALELTPRIRTKRTRTAMTIDRRKHSRVVRSPRGTELSAKSWLTEAPLHMLMNNLDPEVAENPDELVVYGGIGRAARDWAGFD